MNATIDEAEYPERQPRLEHVPTIKCTVQEGTGTITLTLLEAMLTGGEGKWLWSTVVDEGATVVATHPDGTVYTWEPN